MRARKLVCLALVAFGTSVDAQGPVAQDCDYRVVQRLPWTNLDALSRSLYPDSAFVRTADRMAANEWLFLIDSIIGEVEKDAAIAVPQRLIFLDQLQALRSELRAVEASGDPQGFRNRGEGVKQVRFRISSAPGDVYELFADLSAPINVAAVATSSERRALCWRALALTRLLSAYGGAARQLAVEALEESEKRWDNYTRKGYSQYPWELALNSARFSATNQDPPKHQVVFLHPAISLELVAPSLDSLEHLRRQDAITVEPLGFLRYNKPRSVYYGVSSLVSLPSDGRVGVGVMAHIGTYGKLGAILWRAKGVDGRDDRSLLVSADLYQFLFGVPTKLRDAKTKALQAVVREKLLSASQPQ